MKVLLLGLWMIFAGMTLKGQHFLQHPELTTDTTYNVAREFRKHSKKYPHIEVVDAEVGKDLRLDTNLVYSVLGKRILHLDIIRPSGRKKKLLPVVIMVHGGGWRSGDKNMQWPMGFELARNGFAAIPIEYRLSTEALYPASITDLKMAIRWVKAHAERYKLDPNNIALMGCSSGGQMVSLVGSLNGSFEKFDPKELTDQSDKVKAVVDIDGVLSFIHRDSGEGQDKPGKPSAATLWFGKPLETDSASRIEASALTYVGAHSANFLILCSAQSRFHAGRDDFIAALQSHNRHAKFYTVEGTPHTFWLFRPWFDEMMQQIVIFLNDELKK